MRSVRAGLDVVSTVRLALVTAVLACTSKDDTGAVAKVLQGFAQSESTVTWLNSEALPRAHLLRYYNQRDETVMAVASSWLGSSVAVVVRIESAPVRMRIDYWTEGFTSDASATATSPEEPGSAEITPVFFGRMRGIEGEVLLVTSAGESDESVVLAFLVTQGARTMSLMQYSAATDPLSISFRERPLLCRDSSSLVAFASPSAGSTEWWSARDSGLRVGTRPDGCR